MGKINIMAVKDGMVLSEPITNARGGVLWAKGTVLTKAFAARLASRGILTVCIEGDEIEEETASVAQTAEVSKIPLEKLFENKITNDAMRIIYEALIKHRGLNG
jgi:hypothetical protein